MPGGRPPGSKDKVKRKFNKNSGKNGNRNFYKLPCICSTLVTYDPVVRHDNRRSTTEKEAQPEDVKRIARVIEKYWGLVPESEVTWEIGPTTGRVHAHWFMRKQLTTKAEMNAMFNPPLGKERGHRTAMKWLTSLGLKINNYKKGTFCTWKHRFFQSDRYKTDDYVHKDFKRFNHSI